MNDSFVLITFLGDSDGTTAGSCSLHTVWFIRFVLGTSTRASTWMRQEDKYLVCSSLGTFSIRQSIRFLSTVKTSGDVKRYTFRFLENFNIEDLGP